MCSAAPVDSNLAGLMTSLEATARSKDSGLPAVVVQYYASKVLCQGFKVERSHRLCKSVTSESKGKRRGSYIKFRQSAINQYASQYDNEVAIWHLA